MSHTGLRMLRVEGEDEVRGKAVAELLVDDQGKLPVAQVGHAGDGRAEGIRRHAHVTTRKVSTVVHLAGGGVEEGVVRRSFFFNDTATTEIYTLSLHDALPILSARPRADDEHHFDAGARRRARAGREPDARLYTHGLCPLSSGGKPRPPADARRRRDEIGRAHV